MSSRQSAYTGQQHTRATSSSSAAPNNRARQYAHLHAALAQLNARLADTENLLRMTAVQAEYVRGLGGWSGGLFVAAAKVLGEESGAGSMGGDGGTSGAAMTGNTTRRAQGKGGDDGDDDEDNQYVDRTAESSALDQA